jgi:scyllo-inositol 2-dehydrogenase (NADP+)
MTHPIQIGIVGLGRAGWGMHCRELEDRKETFKIVAGCDLRPERLAEMTERFACAVYTEIDELIADPNVELVDIATRSCDHLEHASKALAAGKQVLVEKPMTASHAEALALLDALDASPGGALYVRHNRRFDPDFLHVQEIIASGLLGDVYEIRLARHGYQRRDDWQTLMTYGGGQLLNWGPHVIDHALRFLESPVARQFSDLKRVAAVGDAEDHLKIVLRGENGRIVDLEISGGVALGAPTYQVFGTRGSLTLAGKEIALRYLDPAVSLPPREANHGHPGETFGSPETLAWITDTMPVNPGSNTVIWDALYASIREDVPYPIPLDQAVAVMQVVSTARQGTEFDLP